MAESCSDNIKVCFTFKGEPISKSNAHNAFYNKKLKRCMVYVPAKIKKYEKALGDYAHRIMQEAKQHMILGLVKFTVIYYYRTKRTKDLCNLPKTTADALEKIVYKNDFQIHEVHLYRKLDRVDPRIDIVIEEITDPEWEKG